MPELEFGWSRSRKFQKWPAPATLEKSVAGAENKKFAVSTKNITMLLIPVRYVQTNIIL